MNQEKRALLAIGLCLAVMVAWWGTNTYFAPKKVPPSEPTQAQNNAQKPETQPETPSAAQAATSATATEEVRRVIERPGLYRAEVTSRGAALTRFELLDSKMWSRDLRWLRLAGGKPVQEIRAQDGPTNLLPSYRPTLLVRLPKSDVTLPEPAEQQPFVLASDETLPDETRVLTFALDLPDVKIQKTFSFPPKGLHIGFAVNIENKKQTTSNHHLEVSLESYQDPKQKGGMFSPRVVQNDLVWGKDNSRNSLNLEELQDNKATGDKLEGDVQWFGFAQQYFMVGLALENQATAGRKRITATADAQGAMSAQVVFADKPLPMGQKQTYHFTLYAGPKQPEMLDDVAVNGQKVEMSKAIDYTWGLGMVARPLLSLLRKFFQLTGSWAIAIVLLTLFVKALMLWPSLHAMKSAKAMQTLKPKMDALKLKFPRPEQKNDLNMAMLKLQRENGVNPLGGCLPMLLQMPIWIALYSMLGNAVELYRVRLGWIADMTAADPYYVLPLLTGVLMFLQTKLSAKTTPVDPQMKPVMTMMPIMFTVFSIFLPAGLTLYILTNTVLGIVQQEVINYVNRSNKQPKKGGQGKKGGKTHKEHHANEDQNAVPANDATVEVLHRAQDASSDDGADTGAAKTSAGPKPSDPHKPKAKAKKRK